MESEDKNKEPQANTMWNASWSDVFHNDFQHCPATVTAAEGEVEVQYLVSAAAAESSSCATLLPDASAVQRYFQQKCCGRVCVEDPGDGRYLVTVGNYYRVVYAHEGGLLCYEDLLEPAREKFHTVDSHRVLVDLVVPDVYGCDVTVRERHVQVSVGHDVIANITRDEGWRNGLLYQPVLEGNYIVSVGYVMNAGRINVTCASTKGKSRKWEWELFIIQRLMKLLNPFMASFQTAPRPVTDRCLDKCSRRLLRKNPPSQDIDDRQTDALIKIDSMCCTLINKESFLEKMRTIYPGIQFDCDPDQLTLKLSGGGGLGEGVAKYVWDYIRKVKKEDIHLTDTQASMMENAKAQNWFQHSLESEAVNCDWKLTREGRHTRSRPHSAKSDPKGPRTTISVIATEADIRTVEQTLQTCFPTKRVFLSESQVPHLQSDEWKEIVDELQSPYGTLIPPVLKTDQNKITICDTKSNIDATLRAVLDFFHRCLVGSQQEFCEEVTETVTKLHRWQVKLLTIGQAKNQLPQCLQQTMSARTDLKTVCIHAPVHMIDKCLNVLWDYVADLSRQVISLTEASTQVLEMSDSRESVQAVMDEESILCHWHVQPGQLVICAYHSHMPRARTIILSEVEKTGLNPEPQARQENKTQQTKDVKIRTSDHQQQTEEQEQETTVINKEDKQTQSDIRTEAKKIQTGENEAKAKETPTETFISNQQCRKPQTTDTSIQTQEPQAQIFISNQQFRKPQTTETSVQTQEPQAQIFISNQQFRKPQTTETSVQTQEPQTQTFISNQQFRKPQTTETSVQTQEPQTAQSLLQYTGPQQVDENDTDADSKQTIAQSAETTKNPTLTPVKDRDRPQTRVLDQSDTDSNDGVEYEDALEELSPTSSLQPAQQGPQRLTANSLDSEDGHHSAVQSKDDSHLPDREGIPEERLSLRSQDSVDSSRQDTRERNMTPHTAQWPCELCSELTQALTGAGDRVTSLLHHLNAHPHFITPRSSDETLKKRVNDDVSTDDPDFRDEIIFLNSASGRESIYPLQLNIHVPILGSPSDPESLSGSTETLNSMNSSTASSTTPEGENRTSKKFSPEFDSRVSSAESSVGRTQGVQGFHHPVSQRSGCPTRQPQNTGTPTSRPLNVTSTPRLLSDPAESASRISTTHVPQPAYVSARGPPDQAQSSGNPHLHRNPRASAVPQAAENYAGISSHSNSSPTSQSQRLCSERDRQQQHLARVVEALHEEVTSFSAQAECQQHQNSSQPANNNTAAASATNRNASNASSNSSHRRNNNNNNNNEGLQFLLSSATHARLTHLEHRFLLMDRERAQEPLVRLESRMVALQQQLGEVLHTLHDTFQQHNTSDSDIGTIYNPSETDSESLPSASSSSAPEH